MQLLGRGVSCESSIDLINFAGVSQVTVKIAVKHNGSQGFRGVGWDFLPLEQAGGESMRL